MALLPSPGRVEHEDINLPKLIRVGKPQFNVAPTSAGTKLLVSSFLSTFLLTYPGSQFRSPSYVRCLFLSSSLFIFPRIIARLRFGEAHLPTAA